MNASRKLVVFALTAALMATPTVARSVTDDPSGGPASAVAGDVPQDSTDVRRGLPTLPPTEEQLAAVAALLRSAPGGVSPKVTWNTTYGTPRTVRAPGGHLTAPQAGEPLAIAREWLQVHRAAFGLSAADIEALAVRRDHELPGIGARVVSFTQMFDGVEAVHGGVMTVTVAEDGRVLSYAGDPVRSGGLLAGFDKSPADALAAAVSSLSPSSDFVPLPTGGTQAGYQVFAAGPFAQVQRVRKVAFPTAGGARPAYSVLFVKSLDEAWGVVVDAATGKTLARHSLVHHEGSLEPEGTVYENFPGAPQGGGPVIKSFGPNASSPSGWVDPSGAAGLPGPTTLGNNANTFAQYTAPLAPTDEHNRPLSPTAQFNYAYAANWARTMGQTLPPSYVLDRDPAVTNLFYHHNRIHDEYYQFGFTETAGNFQVNNFGKGGQGGDPISGLAHSGAATGGAPTYLGRDNANMLTLPDGIPSFSSMYLWEPINDAFEGPYADGNFDQTVIQHEYSHGLSNRYVGGGGLGSLGGEQSGAMGEGWGDWYAINHLGREGLYDKAVVGEYAVGNAERGIRNWAYDKNPLTYGDYGYDITGPEVHADGEIWTAMLWDLRSALVDRYGTKAGSDIAEHLVTDAMPLSPPSPSFLDMRDAILDADTLRFHGDNTDTIWTAFARRGAGRSAATAGPDDTDPKPGFDHAAPSRNGMLAVKLVNASTGEPVEDARVIIGEFEARVTPLGTSGSNGVVSAPMVDGAYTMTVQARGFGIQKFRGLSVQSGKTTARTLKLAPNLASKHNGATVVKTSSQDDGLPASLLIDDTEATAWKTKDAGKPYNAGAHQVAEVKLAEEAQVSRIAVSTLKPTTAGRFNVTKDFTVQTSTDGVLWKTVKAGTFAAQAPRPAAPDMQIQTLKLDTPVTASHVRVFVDSIQGETKTYAVLSELQVFGNASGVEPLPFTPDEPVSESGTIQAGEPQGLWYLPGTEPYRPGVTVASWQAACGTPPAAQGADAWITKLPTGWGDGLHVASYAEPESQLGEMQMFFYDSACKPIAGDFATPGQKVVISPGAAYVGLLYLYGADYQFTLTARQAG
ncbi:M36 family metallopeptidase [Streptomyces peucetius]|uniref:M36 family metallopeptidase n=1 Tax=Streptomyces peucetius TaxID=1950 RepID=A0ABY6ICK3_STRPE|nr:M36 family metallopeptidase [Streptomyces peucetius]UYQ64713.1 M36 family metallopeptidase [Streptomyces peucetius]